MTDFDSARRFVELHARLLDRRRFAHLFGDGPAEDVHAAVAAYANADGGYAGVIEPDTRTAASQPIGVLTAFDFLDEAGGRAEEAALDWLRSVSNDDGGLPFSLPTVEDAPHAPWMAPSPGSSLHMTSAVAAAALRLGARHDWLDGAVAFCRERLEGSSELTAYETKYALQFLDALGDVEGIERIGERIPPDGRLPVPGGIEGESLGVLELAPRPDSHARRLFDDAQVEAALDALEAEQHEDGGWDIHWLAWSPAVVHEWRGRLTVDALAMLRAHGRGPG